MKQYSKEDWLEIAKWSLWLAGYILVGFVGFVGFAVLMKITEVGGLYSCGSC